MARFQTSQDASTGGKFVSEPGLYHMIIVAVDEKPTDKKGLSMDNAFMKIFCSVCESTVEGSKDKSFSEIFFLPKPDATDKGREFVLKKITRLLLATNLMTQDQIGQEIDVDLQSMVGAQLCLKIETNDDGYAQIAFADIFHVDDPEVSGWPKDGAALSQIDQSRRGFKALPKQEPVSSPPLDLDDDTPF